MIFVCIKIIFHHYIGIGIHHDNSSTNIGNPQSLVLDILFNFYFYSYKV